MHELLRGFSDKQKGQLLMLALALLLGMGFELSELLEAI